MDTDARFDQLIAQGLAASRQGEADAALALFADAARQQPHSGLPAFLIASEHAAAGQVEAAEAAFAQAVLLAPDFPLARYQLGLLQFSAGRAAVALLTWQPLLALPEGDALPHFVQGFGALARDQLDEALAHFGHGLACEQDNPAVAADVGQVVAQLEASRGLAKESDAAPASAHVLLAGYARGLH